MSWVYQARHLLLERPVALKVVKSDRRGATPEQLQDEATLLARLDHPNLVKTYDLLYHQEMTVFVLELVQGRNLEQVTRVSPNQFLAEVRVLVWAERLLSVLEYLHGKEPPVIMRDLKPKNVMLARDGELRVIDFGLAKRMTDNFRGTSVLVQGMASKGFAPPEQHARAATTPRSDIYSLGATLYFLLTGFAPPPALYRLTEEGPLRDPREVNPSVSVSTWEALQKMLELDPDHRPSSAAEVRGLLLEGVALPVTRPGRRCVGCGLLLRLQKIEGIGVDRCPGCAGVWLDRGELERLKELAKEPVDTQASLEEPRRSALSQLYGFLFD